MLRRAAIVCVRQRRSPVDLFAMHSSDEPTSPLLEAEPPRPRSWLRRAGRIGLGALGGAGLGLAYLWLGACTDGSCLITSHPALLVVLSACVGGFAATRSPG